jgi:hypothetical protein
MLKLALKSSTIGNKGSEVIKDDFKVEFEANKEIKKHHFAGQRGEIELKAITNRLVFQEIH